MKNFYMLLGAALVSMSVMAGPRTLEGSKAKSFEQKPITAAELRALNPDGGQQVRASRSAEEVITNPTGEKTVYAVSTKSYMSDTFYEMDQAGIIYIDGDDYYMKDPVKGASLGGYAKLTRNGDKLRMDLPQIIYSAEMDGVELSYWVTLMANGTTDPDFNPAPVAAEDNYVEYIIAEDGTITMDIDEDLDGVSYILSLVEGSAMDEWMGYGDTYQQYTVADYELNVAPEGLTWETYGMNDGYYNYIVEIAKDGTDVYFRNFYYVFPDVIIKGTLNSNGSITIPSGQYMGVYEAYSVFVWLLISDANYNIKDATLLYDEASQTYYCSDYTLFWINAAQDYIYYIDYLEYPTFTYQSVEDMNANPIAPYPNDKIDWEYSTQYGAVLWVTPNVNVNGYVLDSTKMSVQLYFDDQLFEAYTDEYAIPEDMDRFPLGGFSSSDGYIYTGNDLIVVYFFFTGFDTIGCQSFYEGSDGVTYASEKVTYYWDDLTLGIINPIDDSKEVASERYFDMQGRAVANPTSGLFVKQTIYTDGTASARKVSIR
ncbi:MAG: hypothetical protein LIP09_12685 [Bacteroidales bacterium]|nr:hypothetical protein [Bacteroidales bacterium]